jgi:geranylgeranyl reductase family protein
MAYDAAVIGAGPAGATVAFLLSRAGLKVLLLEKKKLPRFKACGGGISLKFLGSLPFDASPAITGRVSRIKYFYKMADPVEVELGAELAMVNRPKFDLLIVEAAARLGAKVVDESEVRELEILENGVRLSTEKDNYEARYLIGADGVFSQVAARTGLRRGAKFDLALEIELPERKHPLSTLYMGFGQVREGYAWSFPKTDNYSIGIGGKNSPRLAVELKKWLAFLGYPADGKMDLHGHSLPLPKAGEKLQRQNVLLVGDAAGLVNPLTGEGIRYAIQSAQIAAQTIASGKINGYSREIYEKISSDFKYAYYLRTLFAFLPGFCYRYGVKNPAASQFLSGIFCGEAAFKDFYWKAIRFINPIKFLSAR